MGPRLVAAALLVAASGAGQQAPSEPPLRDTGVKAVLERLERIEEQNRALAAEIRLLREELAQSRGAPDQTGQVETPLEERLAVQEARVAEHAGTKVESSQKFPLRITGMALFNAWLNKGEAGDPQYPVFAIPGTRGTGGAGFRQTIIGLEYHGSRTVVGASARGEFYMDFFGASGRILDQAARIRTATIGLDWNTRSLTVGIDKPLFSIREPASLSQVGVSPLTAAGNLWLWIPQVRFEQRAALGERSGLRLQIAGVQTREIPTSVVASGEPYDPAVGPARPGLEGRFEFFHGGEARRLEIAPGFHRSVSHVGPVSVPSNVVSLDWLLRPIAAFEISGIAFTGQNVSHLGTGGIRQGFVVLERNVVRAVRSRGGWAQAAWQPQPRLFIRGFAGVHDDRDRDLFAEAIGRNLAWGANLEYRLASNVRAGFEAARVRTNYVGRGTARNNHYDLALAYLF